MKQQSNNSSQNAAASNQQSGQQTQQQLGQQQLGQQGPSRAQQGIPNSSLSINSGLSLGLDDSLYGSLTNELLQMPTPSGTSSGGLMDFSNTLSPTSFGGMDLLDWDDGATSGQGTSGQNNTTGDTSDLMTFVETL
ncbi:unnamed protein product [Peronospora farinosa]|uniref:Uncharacterized protein n=1 Tax=Peronospora farinosa TaxID=134698 RepID=A0AAV0TY27_9STRA|nr:unnamed protein product [Peronospora farinosa]